MPPKKFSPKLKPIPERQTNTVVVNFNGKYVIVPKNNIHQKGRFTIINMPTGRR